MIEYKYITVLKHWEIQTRKGKPDEKTGRQSQCSGFKMAFIPSRLFQSEVCGKWIPMVPLGAGLKG